MLTFDPNKEKNLSFSISVQGIDPSILEYNLRLSNGNIDYGFKGKNNNGEVTFSIPPLQEVVNNNVLYDLSSVKLEVHDQNNKYYLKPFQDEVKIKKEMKVEAKLAEENDDKSTFSVNASLNEDNDNSDKQEKVNPKPKSKFGSFLKD